MLVHTEIGHLRDSVLSSVSFVLSRCLVHPSFMILVYLVITLSLYHLLFSTSSFIIWAICWRSISLPSCHFLNWGTVKNSFSFLNSLIFSVYFSSISLLDNRNQFWSWDGTRNLWLCVSSAMLLFTISIFSFHNMFCSLWHLLAY